MANLLEDPSLWSVVDNWGPIPIPDTNIWTGSGYEFNFSYPATMAATTEEGELIGSVTINDPGPFDVGLVVLRTYESWPPSWGPPSASYLDAVAEIYYAEQGLEHELDLYIPQAEGYLWVGVYNFNSEGVPQDSPSTYSRMEAIRLEVIPPQPVGKYKVYEMEKGWSFDGKYIPHYLELNWLFQEDPFTYSSIQKIRMHGLVKGMTQLQVSLAGMQPEPIADYISDYSAPQWLDLPYTPMHVSEDFVAATHYVDYSDRGLALQLKFEGRNTDINRPEPAHVLQVLALQGSPKGNGSRSN